MPDALPVATIQVNPGLGRAPEYTGYISRWLGSNNTKEQQQ